MASARADGLPRKGTLGVAFAPVPAELQAKLALKAGEGVIVNRVLPGLTGERAGLQSGDVILTVDGTPVSPPTLGPTVTAIPVGKSVTLGIVRDGRPAERSAPLSEKRRDPGTDRYEVVYSDVLSHGNRMRTIISKPKVPGRHPALMLIQGYSPISYDYDLNGPGLDAPVLYEFARWGFVTMRVEKPGVGDSEGGPFGQVDFVTELDIYRQALLQLKSLDDVDTGNVFIFGHSMGGAFGPIVASEIPVRGIAVYGIEARTWHEYLLDTVRYQGLLAGSTYGYLDEAVRQGSRVMEMVFQDHLSPDRIKIEHPELAATVDSTFPGGLFNGKTADFWGQLENTNFASYWEKCNTRVFAVHGASDFVSYKVDHELVADIVNRVHPGWGRFATAPSSDHLFSNWATEAESLKHWPTGTFNPAFIGMLKGWIREVMKTRG
jgi:pimeloyl-ACP methyl ester carboxylesterase